MFLRLLGTLAAASMLALAAPPATPAAPAAPAVQAATPPTLSEQHKTLGLDCKDCHGTKEKSEGVDMEQCLTCHESWAKLKLSARTARHHPNPHDGHYPDLDCNNCHHGHKAMENYCDNCHKK